MHRKKIVLLGSTGSIGCSTLKVAADLPSAIEIIGLAAHSNIEKLAAQAKVTGVKHVAIYDESKVEDLRKLLATDVTIYFGAQGLIDISTLTEAETVLVAIVGTAGLKPSLAAIKSGKNLAIASKEILVMAGELVMREAKKYGVHILPVDSEHNAIFQCLQGHSDKHVSRLVITASGGAFRNTSEEELKYVTLAQAMKHPTWNMGRKITIDSSSMFNKGLEMIEAKWLFNIEMDKIDVVIHPQSIIHSMVEFCDGSILAQLSNTDMCFPIQYALTWPSRLKGNMKPLNFPELAKLEFEAPRHNVFPAINLAREAGNIGGTMPAVYNAANEIAVKQFISSSITFTGIWKNVEKAMNAHQSVSASELDSILQADKWARDFTANLF
jgi:1-deoxy-D-xylulose-5-phosphate reductoisomerase